MNKDAKKNSKGVVAMPLINPNAPGIDVGDTLFSVAVPEGRDEVRCREFEAFTCDLRDISGWLKKCEIETVAMESTGVIYKRYLNLWKANGVKNICLP